MKILFNKNCKYEAINTCEVDGTVPIKMCPETCVSGFSSKWKSCCKVKLKLGLEEESILPSVGVMETTE